MMRLDWSTLLEVLRGCSKVVLTSHVRPDCDALGSELGMAGILEAIGKHVRIVNAQATPASLKWIDPRGKIESLAEKVRPADLAVRDLSTDTGGFRFPSVSGESFRIAGRLVDAGANPTAIYRELFEQDTLARLHLVGRTIAGAVTSHDGKVIISTVRQHDIKEVKAQPADTEDLVNLTLSVKGTEVAAILIEQPDGRIKVSFRSRGRLDCNALAARFGGGGHKAAAGTIIDGPFDPAHERVVAAVDEAWLAQQAAVA